MGPTDYLELCSRYHTIVVQNVPTMGLAQKNEARRFITFLDAAYENHVKVVLSAEDEPENLFVIEDISSVDALDANEDAMMHREMLGDLLGGMTLVPKKKKTGDGSDDGEKDLGVAGMDFSNASDMYEIQKLAMVTGEDEKFAFKRAVSRIQEMRSAGWASAVGGRLARWEAENASEQQHEENGKISSSKSGAVGGGHRPVKLDWSGLNQIRRVPGAVDDRVSVLHDPSSSTDPSSSDGSITTENNNRSHVIAAAVVGQDAPRGFIPMNSESILKSSSADLKKSKEEERPPSVDDFSDEAGYRGYVLEMYERLETNGIKSKRMEPLIIKTTKEKNGPVLLAMLDDKEKAAPKLKEVHFWGVGNWGPRSGKWGQGVRAFWSNFVDGPPKKVEDAVKGDVKSGTNRKNE
jgi:hypothetical protein